MLLVLVAAISAPVRPLPLAPAGAARSGQGPARERERDEERERAGAGAWDLTAADMNGDRRLDLIVASGGPGDENGVIQVLLNPGVGMPLDNWERVTLAGMHGDYGRLAVGDIDGDGDNDVAALTFGTRVLRWWLLAPDLSVVEERSMAFDGMGTGSCPGPELGLAAPQTLSALAFADLDADRVLDLAVTSYASGDTGRAFLFSFERASHCFVLRPGFPQATRGSLRVRFFDVDDDGALDIVASHYALASATDGSGAIEWGSWWPASSGAPRPLVARLDDLRELMEATPTPELNIVDFDALRTPEGARFALAGSAHLCPAADCWSAGAAGLVGVVDDTGRQLYLGGAWKRDAELAPPFPGARLLPRSVSFRGPSEHPSVIAGYWWATRHKASPCNRIEPCAGPLVESALAGDELAERTEPAEPAESGTGAEAPDTIDPAAFVQALSLLDAPDSAPELRRHCVDFATPLLALPDAPVSSVIGVDLGARALPTSAWSWTPGSSVVGLASPYRHVRSRACIDYLASARVQLAIADSRTGARLVPL